MKLVFMGTPLFAVPTLRGLYNAGHEIAAIYTQPPRPAGRGQKLTPSPIHSFALEYRLPVFTPESLKSPEAQMEFLSHKADAAIVVAYGLLLPKPILEAFPFGCINVHPSLLPRWRGAAPIQRTIMAGDRETAIVIMQMDAGLDTGDILLQERYSIAKGTTGGILHDQLSEKAPYLVLKTLSGLQNKTITPMRQMDTGVEYAKKITKDDCHIDWNQPAEVIYNQILGLSPVPGAFFQVGSEIIKIFDAVFDMKSTGALAGTVVDNKLSIACNPGVVYPRILQRPGKTRMALDELLKSFIVSPGTKLL